MQKFAATAALVQATVGTSIEDTVKAFAELGEEPLKATKKLNKGMLYRRKLVMLALDSMKAVGVCCEFPLDYALAKPHTKPAPSTWPVHVAMVGRLWRQHDYNGNKRFQDSDFDRMARVLGYQTMHALRSDGCRKSG